MPFLASVEGAFSFGKAYQSSGGDAIAASLTTSLASYQAASSGSWVKITSTEYANLQTNVLNTTKVGITDTMMTNASGANFGSTNLQTANAIGGSVVAIPANRYIYAFSMKNTSAISNLRCLANKNTASPATGYSYVGGILPTTTTGINYYVLKGVSATNGAVAGVLGMWAQSANCGAMQTGNTGGGGIYYSWPVTNPLTETLISFNIGSGNHMAIQGLVTTTIQW
jgi:hypothetical protein